MAMKKLGMSVITASLLSTAAYAAGTLTVKGGLISASTEYLELEDANRNILNVLNYKSGMKLATASEAGFELKFPSTVTPSSDGNLSIQVDNPKEVDDNTTVATFDRVDGNSIIFSSVSGTSIQRNKSYKIVSDDNVTVNPGALHLLIKKGTAGVEAQLIVSDNTGVNILDDVTAKIIETKSQFSGSFGTKLDAQIDASDSFRSFTNGTFTSYLDDFSYTFANDKDIDIATTATKVEYVVTPDTNLSTYGVSLSRGWTADVAVSGSWIPRTDFIATTVNDKKWTITDATNGDKNGSITQALSATVAPTEDMGIVAFKAIGSVTYLAATKTATKTLFQNVDAGNWSIYGYTAQIPNVVGIENVIETTMKFTNRSSIDTNIYFTLIDPDGTKAILNSVDNTELSSLAKDTTSTYKASDLLALITDSEFNKKGSISVEVAIPTTPDLVYGMASFKNIKLGGQFKDLPVYNSSRLSY